MTFPDIVAPGALRNDIPVGHARSGSSALALPSISPEAQGPLGHLPWTVSRLNSRSDVPRNASPYSDNEYPGIYDDVDDAEMEAVEAARCAMTPRHQSINAPDSDRCCNAQPAASALFQNSAPSL